MGWIDSIASGIDSALQASFPALMPVPAILLICEVFNKPGLSAIRLTANIIKRLPEAGIETGVNVDGSPNQINQFVRVISEEIVNHIHDAAKVSLVMKPGAVISLGSGTSPVGPVVVTSTNIMPSSGAGLIQ